MMAEGWAGINIPQQTKEILKNVAKVFLIQVDIIKMKCILWELV